jgi:hypothetical protein
VGSEPRQVRATRRKTRRRCRRLSGRPERPRLRAGGLPVSAHIGAAAAYLAGHPKAPPTLTPDARAAWRAHVDLAAVGPAAAALADALTRGPLAADRPRVALRRCRPRRGVAAPPRGHREDRHNDPDHNHHQQFGRPRAHGSASVDLRQPQPVRCGWQDGSSGLGELDVGTHRTGWTWSRSGGRPDADAGDEEAHPRAPAVGLAPSLATPAGSLQVDLLLVGSARSLPGSLRSRWASQLLARLFRLLLLRLQDGRRFGSPIRGQQG